MLRLVIEAISLTPLDLPQRATQVRVAWKSGAVTELSVDRPEHGRITSQPAAERVRELCAQALSDNQIAVQLNAEGVRTGAQREWTAWAVARVRARERLSSSAPLVPRPRVPDQDEQGRFSVAGAARHFGVSVHVVRGWISQGRVKATREAYGAHHDTLWLTIDRPTAKRLKDFLAGTANRYPRSASPPSPSTQTELPAVPQVPRPRVPDQDEQGRFSVAGAARHFGVSVHVVRSWISQGRVKATREAHGAHHDTLWLTIDRTTTKGLKDLLARTANRSPRSVSPPSPSIQTEPPATGKVVS
jgi:transposase